MKSALQLKRVLVVEDDDCHAELIKRCFSGLSDQYVLTVTGTLRDALDRVSSRCFDIVLTDYMLPDGKGGELVQRSADIAPVVMMTSQGNEQVAVEAMKLGALDYVVKMPEVFEAMPRIIERALREWDLMVEHRLAGEALRHQTVRLENEIAVRKMAQETLRLSEEKFFKAFEMAPLIMAITTMEDGTFLEVNRKFLQLSGYSRHELLGRSSSELGWITAAAGSVILETMRREGQVSGLEVTLHAKDGRAIKSEYYGETISVDGQLRLLSIAQDVTARRKLEEQLRHSQKLEAVGLLAGGISHDFNNILTVIGGYCQMLKAELAPGQRAREMVQQIATASERAANLTRSLLAFSRKGEVRTSTVDLNEIVRRVEKFLQRIIGEDVTLDTSPGEEPLWAVVDSGQIEQVLMNLATNARDAMPRGGTFLVQTEIQEMDDGFVQLHGFGRPGRFALLTVSDSGVGMDEVTRSRIFDPFFTTKGAGQGTGLGLAIVYGIVSQHNGFVNVYSEPGVGTTFKIYLPMAQALAVAELDEDDPESAPGGSETILVAEDDPHVLEMVSSILRQHGYSVVTAVNGLQAVQMFREAAIDLVLIDIIMPVMNGKEASELIYRLQPHARILFTSGYTADIIRSRSDLDSSAELIMKPVSPFDLLRKVRTMLDRR